MEIIMPLTIVFILITYVYVRWVQLKQYWAKRGVRHVPPHPLLGSLTFLQKENPALWFRRIYEKFKEPYVGIWLFLRPGLVVNSEQIARNILIRDQANFRNRYASSGTIDPIGRYNLFTLNDPLSSAIRKRLTPFFTGSKLRGVQTLIMEKSKQLVERIEKERGTLKHINLKNVMTDFSTDIIGTAVFGVVSDAVINEESPIRTITNVLTKYDFVRAVSWCSVFYIPELVDIFRLRMFPTETNEYMRIMLRNILAQREGLETKVTDPKDFLDVMIKIKQEANEDVEMTENMMLSLATTFIMAGFETTAATLSFGIYELAFCSEVQDKLYEELQKAKDKHGESLLEASILSQLTYLNCVINETLRKYPVLGALDRIALKDYKVDEHLTIKAGTPVFVNVMGLHHDSDFYPDPDTFNPDRFLPEKDNTCKPFAYLPFGEGPRNCIGKRFGLLTVRHGLTALLLNYQIKPIPNFTKPSEVKLDKDSIIIIPGEDLMVKFVPRK